MYLATVHSTPQPSSGQIAPNISSERPPLLRLTLQLHVTSTNTNFANIMSDADPIQFAYWYYR